MSFPVALPTRSSARPHHCTTEINTTGRDTPGRSSAATGTSLRPAAHRCGSDLYVTCAKPASLPTKQAYQHVAGLDGSLRWAGVTRLARTGHLSRSDPSQTDLRAFGTPDWPVAVPDGSWCAGKDLAYRHAKDRCDKKAHRAIESLAPQEVRRSTAARDFAASRIIRSPLRRHPGQAWCYTLDRQPARAQLLPHEPQRS